MNNYYNKVKVYPMILVGMLMFTACSSTEKPATNTATPSTSPSATSSPLVSATPTPESPVSSTPEPTANPVENVKPSPSAANSNTASKQIKDMLELAKSGKIDGITFAAKTSLIDDVEKSWGKADKKEAAGSGFYATYAKKNADFGYNKGSQIFDIRSSDPKLKTITLSQIEQALGKPTDTKMNGDDTIYIYKASDVFQLKFIIPKSTGKVDHISVFDEKDSVNNMAK
jgi:PBP1b-binding outer membrane lipoprotein LpoB